LPLPAGKAKRRPENDMIGTPQHDIEQTIRQHVATHAAAEIDFLAALVRTPSDNPPGDCAAHAEMTAGRLESLGFTVEPHSVPAELCRAHGMIAVTNLIVRRKFGPGPVIALNAHGDVVPPGAGWTVDPYSARIVDGAMYGRGVAVSKSDIATYAFALLAAERSGARLGGSVELHITYDEETGGEIGPLWLLEQGISRPDMAVAAGFSYAVLTAHNGCLHLEVEVTGKSAHAAKPWTGVDALEAANGVMRSLYEHRRMLKERVSSFPNIGAPQLTIGLISGGINTNVVPDRVVFRLDRRITPEEEPGAVETELRALIETTTQIYPGARAVVRRVLLAEPLRPLPGTAQLADLFCRRASQVMGEPVVASGAPLYTDARHYAAKGIPIILYGAGPRTIEEANAHRADERLQLVDLTNATEVVALALTDLLR
jgi:succinyl-diaminopimelate desuccinylase